VVKLYKCLSISRKISTRLSTHNRNSELARPSSHIATPGIVQQ